MPLSDIAIRAAKPGPKPIKLSDERGLFLLVQPSGGNAHIPRGGAFQRQVFHTHGQPQATISFLELSDVREVKDRRNLGRLDRNGNRGWKFPPAGA